MHPFVRLLKRLRLTEIKLPGAAFTLFQKRTTGMLEARLAKVTHPDFLTRELELYGYDCYYQGTLDATESILNNRGILDASPFSDIQGSGEGTPQASGETLPGTAPTEERGTIAEGKAVC